VDRACRGAHAGDNSPAYMKVVPSQSIFDCKAVCLSDAECKGIESSLGRCEVWTRPGGIQASAKVTNFTCLTLGPRLFEVKGDGRVCRGDNETDNAETYYEVVPDSSLDGCMWSCTAMPSCTGIEFSAGRCEVWTKAISATLPLEGFACWQYTRSLQAVQRRKSRRQNFLGLLQTSSKENRLATRLEEPSEEL